MRIRLSNKDLFHTHPWDERKFDLDKDHVICDRKAFLAAIDEIQTLRLQLSNAKKEI